MMKKGYHKLLYLDATNSTQYDYLFINLVVPDEFGIRDPPLEVELHENGLNSPKLYPSPKEMVCGTFICVPSKKCFLGL